MKESDHHRVRRGRREKRHRIPEINSPISAHLRTLRGFINLLPRFGIKSISYYLTRSNGGVGDIRVIQVQGLQVGQRDKRRDAGIRGAGLPPWG